MAAAASAATTGHVITSQETTTSGQLVDFHIQIFLHIFHSYS